MDLCIVLDHYKIGLYKVLCLTSCINTWTRNNVYFYYNETVMIADKFRHAF